MKEILKWILGSLTSIFLPSLCIIIGIILVLYGMYINQKVNDTGGIMASIGIILFLLGLVLPVYFFIKSLFFSIKDLSSKDSTRKISGILGIIFLVIFILSVRDYVFNMSSNVITALIILLVVSFAFLIILMIIIKMLYLIVSSLIRFLTGLRGKK